MYRHSHRYLDHTCSRDRTAHQQWCRWRLVLLVRLLLRMSEWNCARPQFFTAYYFADKVSLMSSVYTHRYDSVDHRRLGAMPLVVSTPWIRCSANSTPGRSLETICAGLPGSCHC